MSEARGYGWYEQAELPRPQLTGEHKNPIGFTSKTAADRAEERLKARGIVIVRDIKSQAKP